MQSINLHLLSRKTNVIPFHPSLSISLSLSLSLSHRHTHIHTFTAIPVSAQFPETPPFLHHPLRAESGLALQRTGMPGARSGSHINTHRQRPCPRSNGLCEHATCSSTAASVSALVCGGHVRFVCECNSSCTTRVCFPLLRWTADSAACGVSLLSWTRVCVCVCVCVCGLFALYLPWGLMFKQTSHWPAQQSPQTVRDQ